SKDNSQELVQFFEANRNQRAARTGEKLPEFVNIRQRNMGLSHARNEGARNAKGEIFAYTDSDCMADPDWLYYLVGTLLSGDFVGVGGPNISPPAVDWIQAAVSGAPGGPSHVLLTDVVAEHIPGCKMWSIGRRATTWIFVGGCRPTVGLSRFLRVRLSGTIGVLRCRLFVSSRRVTVRRSRCCVLSTSFSLAPRARRNGRDKFTGPHGSLGFSTVRLFTTAYLGKGYFSRYIPPHNRK
ncbi:MAG: glycosyltransferase family 2 protein, partial [Proteobacteria bacterium]|nr:glycosyltransferase family 2 protein [Pseudomonadota bacterium]